MNTQKISPQEVERLYCLDEELHAVGNTLAKILQWGYDPEKRKRLGEEVGYLYCALKSLLDNGDIDPSLVEKNFAAKKASFQKQQQE
jgi:hypothetical protein